ncbi:MAG: alpha-D-ribose 1-methylphosphonate 5-triphosphate diphosphatase [Nitrospirae bacterium]|nr:alpha-D-ribose 1-methylphosphonate 5-triphosphate diphosphatase [Nitrospirota bacterium]MCL5423129.1 alpha-D-ribose 1-methylphosphonate 5-triphosphate diphosphatase [Nitrospirota bacterium]
MSGRDFVIENAALVLPSGIAERTSIKIEDGIISKIREGNINSGGMRINAQGRYILPGFIDLHSDAIEKEIEPRPNSHFPVNIALFELDKKLAACGVTTIFHAVSFAEGEIGVRSNKTATVIIRETNRLNAKMWVKTKVHARFEITDDGAIPYLEDLLKDGCINLLSFMDHTPGQGQFNEVTSFKNYFGTVYKKSDAELIKIIDRKLAAKESVKSHIDYVVALCKSMNIPMASHDDDSEEKIQWLTETGIRISEFPVNMEAVRSAKVSEIYVCLGSPNVLRGNSQAKNLSARDAISSGYADILCSDYSPMTILHAVFTLERLGILPLHEAVHMVSLNPAKAAGISEQTGSIEEGKDADLVVVNTGDEIPRIAKTFVSGREVFSVC